MAPSTESSEEIAFVTQLLLRHTDVISERALCKYQTLLFEG